MTEAPGRTKTGRETTTITARLWRSLTEQLTEAEASGLPERSGRFGWRGIQWPSVCGVESGEEQRIGAALVRTACRWGYPLNGNDSGTRQWPEVTGVHRTATRVLPSIPRTTAGIKAPQQIIIKRGNRSWHTRVGHGKPNGSEARGRTMFRPHSLGFKTAPPQAHKNIPDHDQQRGGWGPLSSHINICSWYVNGIESIYQDPEAQEYDIILLQETWSLDLTAMSGYTAFPIPARVQANMDKQREAWQP
ncbi:hypothetical protein NDU88_000056 [Pleurodeles waltl]|uniref:Uncharacterized protein n=1 Tax=Pleurodeles waltl TaxID=8319 RepID=A0AAV7VWA7_PLEWA|nr:hypothetical protein NDU88_000056 [Pleurodeles waltl]